MALITTRDCQYHLEKVKKFKTQTFSFGTGISTKASRFFREGRGTKGLMTMGALTALDTSCTGMGDLENERDRLEDRLLDLLLDLLLQRESRGEV